MTGGAGRGGAGGHEDEQWYTSYVHRGRVGYCDTIVQAMEGWLMRQRPVEGRGRTLRQPDAPHEWGPRPLLEQTLTKPPPIRSALNCSLLDIAR